MRPAERRGKRRIALAGVLVFLGMAAAAVCGYVSRSPLGRSQQLTDIIDFDPPCVGRCGDVAAAWEALRGLPQYREFARTPQGKEFLSSNFIARAANAIDERGKVLGLSIVDVFDVMGGEVVLAAVPSDGDEYAFLVASRVRSVANALLGVHAALGAASRLPTDAGEWWAVIDRSQAIAWSKVGDVLAASNSTGLLARFIAAARRGRLGGHRIDFGGISGHRTYCPEVRIRIGDRGNRGTSYFSQVDKHDVSVSRFPGFASFVRLVCSYFPANTCAGGAWKLDPAALWRLALAAMPEAARAAATRYVEDHLCAVLDVDDFERDVLGRLTGEFALAVSNDADEWASLACGAPVPTVSVVLRMRTDRAFEARLRHALVEAATLLDASDPHLVATAPWEREHGEYRMAVLHVGRSAPQAQAGADAGYFIAADPEAPGHSLIVASTSLDWLERAIGAREKREASLQDSEWFRRLLDEQPPGRSVFFFAHGGVLADVLGRAGGDSHGSSGAGPWLRLLGPVSASGDVGENGIVRVVLRVGDDQR